MKSGLKLLGILFLILIVGFTPYYKHYHSLKLGLLATSSATDCSGKVVTTFPTITISNGNVSCTVAQSGTAQIVGVEFEGGGRRFTFPQKISDGVKIYTLPPSSYIFRVLGTFSYYVDQYGRVHCGAISANLSN